MKIRNIFLLSLFVAFFIYPFNVFANVVVNSSDSKNLSLSVRLPELELNETEFSDGQSYTTISVSGAGEHEPGEPNVPCFGKWILIPNGCNVSVSASEGSSEVFSDINLAPVQKQPYDYTGAPIPEFVQNENIYSNNAEFPGNFAETGEIKKKRGQQCAILWIYPYQYNPVKKTLRVYKDLNITIFFSGSIEPIPANLWNEGLDKSLRSMAINAEEVLRAEMLVQKIDLNKNRVPGYEMLIIADPLFEDAANDLADWKKRLGITCKVATTTETGTTANHIESYIDNEYLTCNPAPSYLLLFGDVEHIPTWYMDDDPPSDIYYADVDFPADLVADITSGRISVDTETEADNFVSRIIQYEETPPSLNSFYQNATFMSIFQDGHWHWEVNAQGDSIKVDNPPDGFASRRFSHTSEDVREFLDTDEGYNTERIYQTENHCANDNSAEVFPTNWTTNYVFENDSPGGGDPIPADLLKPGFAWDGNGNDASNAFNNGTFLFLYRAHGGRGGWFDFHINEVNNLTNGELRPMIWSPTCQTGWFDNETDGSHAPNEECFAEVWLRHSSGGSVGIMATSRNSLSGSNDRVVWGATDAIWPEFTTTCNDPYGSSQPIYRMGDVMQYALEYLSTKYSSPDYTQKIYHWFGDPTIEIRKQTPMNITNAEVTSNIDIGTSQVTVQVTPAQADFTVTFMSYENDIFGTATTNASGIATINLNSSITEEAIYNVTVSKDQYKPFLLPVGWLPAIWTGEGSQMWNLAGNWLYNFIPSTSHNVLIPSGCSLYPWIISSDVDCNSVEIENGASLTIHGRTLEVQEDVNIYGELILDDDAAELTVYDDLYWRSGSTADISADAATINVYDVFKFYSGSNVQLDKGTVYMLGSENSQVSASDNSGYLNNLYINKSSFATVLIGGEFSSDLIVKGTLTVGSNSIVTDIYEGRDLILYGDINSNGYFQFNVANVEFSGEVQYMNMSAGDYFDDVIINSSTIVRLSDVLTINGNLHINYGNLTCNGFDVYIGGNWNNDAGALLGFFQENGSVTFNGTVDQYCYGEQFNNLILNKSSGELIIPNGAEVSCAGYNWTQGILTVDGGTFTTDDILDQNIVGTYQLIDGQIDLHQDAVFFPDVNGSIIIYDGVFNIHGGGDDCYFAAAQDAYLYMEGGVLDIKDWGIHIDDANQFSHVISGGTIKMNGSFTSDRHDFAPTGGYVHLYGSDDAEIDFGWGNEFYHLVTNKTVSRNTKNKSSKTIISSKRRKTKIQNTRSGTVTLLNDLSVLGNMEITSGIFDLAGNSLQVDGNLAIYGNLKMIDPLDLLQIGSDIVWKSGSTENITAGELIVGNDWFFKDGCNVTLGVGNTVRFTGTDISEITIEEFDNAEFGTLILNKTGNYTTREMFYSSDTKIIGDFTIMENNEFRSWYAEIDGDLLMESGSEYIIESGQVDLAGDFDCSGHLNIGSGNFTADQDFILNSTGELTVDQGSCTLNKPYTGNFLTFAGTLNLIDGYIAVWDENVKFTSTPNITNGQIQLGRGLTANTSNAFQPNSGSVRFIGSQWSNVDVTNGNYFYDMTVQKSETLRGCMLNDSLLVQNDLRINSGLLNGYGNNIAVNNDIFIESSGKLDPGNGNVALGRNWSNNRGSVGFVEGSGTVQLFGNTVSTILSDETFNSLEINKNAGSMYYSDLAEGINVHIENNLDIYNGKLLLNNNSTLDIDKNLTMLDETAIRVFEDAVGVQLNVGGQWYDYNNDNASYTSFIPGNSTVTCDGDSTQSLYTNRYSYDFDDLIIDTNGSEIYIFPSVHIAGDFAIQSGVWNNYNGGLEHVFCGNVSICDDGWINNNTNVGFVADHQVTFVSLGNDAQFRDIYIGDIPRNSSNVFGNDDNSHNTKNNRSTTELIINSKLHSTRNLAISNGLLDLNSNECIVSSDLDIGYDGKLVVDENAVLMIGDYGQLKVQNGGDLEVIGSSSNEATITGLYGYPYNFNVFSGGTISAEFGIIEYLATDGVYVRDGATVDIEHAFNNCTFRIGDYNGQLLRIENDQDLTATNVTFPENTWNGMYNVVKYSDHGSINFVSVFGDFAGSTYEGDMYNRIDWTMGPQIEVYTSTIQDTMDFGDIPVGLSITETMSIYNSGGMNLVGDITTPNGFSISEMIVRDRDNNKIKRNKIKGRNVLSFDILPGNMIDYNVIFEPTALQEYDDTMVITHNGGSADYLVQCLGSGIGAEISVNPIEVEMLMAADETTDWLVTLTNTGNDTLDYFAYVDYADRNRTTIIDEGFEGSFPPSGWNLVAVDPGSGLWYQSEWNQHSGDYCAATDMMGSDTRLITPNFSATVNTYLSFWLFGSGMEESLFRVEVSTDGSNWASILDISPMSMAGYYEKKIVDLSSYAGQSIQVAFHVYDTWWMSEFYLDDVFVGGEVPTAGWLSINGNNSDSDSILPNLSDDLLILDFDTNGLVDGLYNADIHVINNSWNSEDFVIPVDLEVLSTIDPPQDISISVVGDNIEISWTPVSGATSYSIYSANSPDGSYSLEEANITETNWTESITGREKYYQITTVK